MQVKEKVSESTIWGLSFIALGIAVASSDTSCHNSSAFSYSSFIKTAEDEMRARDSIRHGLMWGSVSAAAISLFAYIATNRDWRWMLATFTASELVLLAHAHHFDVILKNNREEYDYTYPPTQEEP